jgi:gamma-glutamyltranspeptidase
LFHHFAFYYTFHYPCQFTETFLSELEQLLQHLVTFRGRGLPMQSNVSTHGMAVAPHHLASQSALAILREGGSAIEAMVAAAATIAVVYPHMNGLGGDGFWLIVPPGGEPIAIDASGAAVRWRHLPPMMATQSPSSRPARAR